MYAGATLSEGTGEVIDKVVNFSEKPQTTSIKLDGTPKVESEGTEGVLTSASLEDTSTLE